jgi:histone H3/H4
MARKRNQNGFVVGSKVREFVRANRCMAGSDLLGALNKQVAALLKNAVERAKNNKRKTVRSYDL